MSNNNGIPATVGLIMDGNGRWAKNNGLKRGEGHTKGIENMIKITAHAFEVGVKNMVCYGLSTENLSRPEEEINHIYDLVIKVFDIFVTVFSRLKACVKYIGDLDRLPEAVRESMKRSENALNKFEGRGRTIYVAIAYGSRKEIVSAVNRAIALGKPVDEDSFLNMLEMPEEPELIIRTGGESRLSNFLLYQSSYSELYFSDKYFPDFDNSDFDEALAWYAKRSRRHGQI